MPWLRLAVALRWFLDVRFRWSEGLDWLEQMLAANQEAPASLRIKALYNELLPRLKSIELAGTPKNTLANFVSGLKTLPVKYQFA